MSQNTQNKQIQITEFNVYLKAQHSNQRSLIGTLKHANSTIQLFKEIGQNKSNIDITLGDHFNAINDLNCGCKASLTNGSIIDSMEDSVLVNTPFVLQIMDTKIENNGTFEKWCINKFCYVEITNDSLDLSQNVTEIPTKSNNYFTNKFGKKTVIIFIIAPISTVIILGIFGSFWFYNSKVKKRKLQKQQVAASIVNQNRVLSPVQNSHLKTFSPKKSSSNEWTWKS